MRILLIGIGLFPQIVAGDKNFFVRLIPHLAEGCESIDVVSINDLNGSKEEVFNKCRVTFHNIPRACHIGDRGRFFAGKGDTIDYHHKHPPLREIGEVLLTIVAQIPRLRRLVNNRRIDVIHFMDNMGPSMRLIKNIFPQVIVTHSAMTYSPRGRFYDQYILFSMKRLDKIIAYSQAYAVRLRELGLDQNRIDVVRWGVEVKSSSLSEAEKNKTREQYGIPKDAYLLLWTGFIQHINENDFRAAVRVAEKIKAVRPNCWFIFAFKPKSFRSEFKEMESEGIRVVTNVQSFPQLLETADFMYSPSLRPEVIVAPPLTWLEAMSMGTPIITTNTGGVDEIVRHGETGFVAQSFESLADTVIDAVDHVGLDAVNQNSREFIAVNCDIHSVAERYLQIWQRDKKANENHNLQ